MERVTFDEGIAAGFGDRLPTDDLPLPETPMTTIDPGKRRTAAASDLYSILIVAGFHSLLIFPWILSDSTTTFRYMNAAPCPLVRQVLCRPAFRTRNYWKVAFCHRKRRVLIASRRPFKQTYMP